MPRIPEHSNITRREWIAAAATATGIAFASRQGGALAAAAHALKEHGDPLREFGYGDVRGGDSPQQVQLEQTHAVLMGLNEDSLLRPFRIASGLAAPGYDLGGWYSATPETVKTGPTGPETFGQWLSALSRYHAATGDEPTRLKVQRLVEGFEKTIEPTGKIFQLTAGRAYFYDKLVSGLVDANAHANIASALGVLEKTTDAALPHLTGKAIDPLGPQGQNAQESYTLPENQFIAWERGAGQRHLEMAKQYLADDFYFSPLARGENVLPGRHAYSHANALSSAARAYLALGDEKHLKAAINGLRFMEAQSYATGAWGAAETFLPGKLSAEQLATLQQWNIEPSAFDNLGQAILKLHTHFETPCGSYAHFKLTRYLLRITRNPHYGDSMERVMYNCALGALPLNRFGQAFYQSNYSRYATKTYFDGYGHVMEDEWPCCSGTLPQVAADYGISTYFRDAEGVFVNLYIPSTLRWMQAGAHITLHQAGRYPLTDDMTFGVEASRPTRFSLRLRVPKWAAEPSIRVNGKSLAAPVKPGTFTAITRTWRSGDRIEVVFPKRRELQAVDAQHPDLVALVNGPLVLFAIGHELPKLSRERLLAARQTAPAGAQWMSGEVRFMPWWVIKDEIYTTYHDVG